MIKSFIVRVDGQGRFFIPDEVLKEMDIQPGAFLELSFNTGNKAANFKRRYTDLKLHEKVYPAQHSRFMEALFAEWNKQKED